MRVHDDQGSAFDATVELTGTGAEAAITFESRGPGRNVDYRAAFDAVLVRLSKLGGAVITDATLVSRDARRLPLRDRRLRRPALSYPLHLVDQKAALAISSELRSAAAGTARQPGAKGTGNRTKRVELRLSLNDATKPNSWLAEQLLNPAQSVETRVVQEYVRPRSSPAGQGFSLDPEARLLVEQYAMGRALAYFAARGAVVRDVSRQESFDLLCIQEEQEFHVEVKGTTGAGRSILLTRNEVEHAKAKFPHIALFVVSEISLRFVDGARTATGGTERVFHPWTIAPEHLQPQAFSLTLLSSKEAAVTGTETEGEHP